MKILFEIASCVPLREDFNLLVEFAGCLWQIEDTLLVLMAYIDRPAGGCIEI